MKFSTSFSVLALVLPTIVSAVPAADKAGSMLARQNNNQGGNQRGGGGRFGQGQGGKGQGQGGKGNAGGAAAGGAAAASSSAAAAGNTAAAGGAAAGGAAAGGAAAGGAAAGGAAAGGAAAGGAAAGGAQNNAGNNGGGAAAGGDPQKSTTLDASVIAAGFADNGQNPPVAGQSASLTSTNNFINFCVGKTITNGQQLKGGSCNPCPIGDIPSFDNMPSAKFVFPANGDTSIAPNTAFTIKMNIQKMQTGVFVNAQKNYFAAPQQLNGGGQIIGHTHFTVESLADGVGQTTPTDPGTFVFFKGINDAAAGGIASTSVDDGLPAGAYRVCSINSSSNHQPVIVPVAQHGSLDDCSYFQVGGAAGGAAAGGAAAGGAAAGGAAAGGAAAGGNANAGGAAAGGNANAGGAAAGGNANAGGAAAGGNANAGGAAAGGNANAGGAAAGGNGGNKGQGQGQGGNKGGQGGNKNNRRFTRFAREN